MADSFVVVSLQAAHTLFRLLDTTHIMSARIDGDNILFGVRDDGWGSEYEGQVVTPEIILAADLRLLPVEVSGVKWPNSDRIITNEEVLSMTPYSFPIVLTAIGAQGQEGQPLAGFPFYRLSGATVRRGVSAFMVLTVIGKKGAPTIGVTVVNLFPDGKGEVQQTDGNGVARFQFGPSSAFTMPGEGPFTVFIADTASKDDETKLVKFEKKLSDTVRSLGDFQGTHTEIYLQFVEQETADAPPPPPVIADPIVRNDDELRALAYSIPPEPVSYLPTAAFSRKARELKLGMAVRTERRFVDGTKIRWGWQAFNGGILKAVEGNWDVITLVEW